MDFQEVGWGTWTEDSGLDGRLMFKCIFKKLGGGGGGHGQD